jgi:hypothetical protein
MLEKLLVSDLAKASITLCGTRSFITVFTTALHMYDKPHVVEKASVNKHTQRPVFHVRFLNSRLSGCLGGKRQVVSMHTMKACEVWR